MVYMLTGGIARTQPYQLDKTLSLEGAGAEAKATGEAIAEAKKQTQTHAERTDNPHKVTKEQVGLGNVDNTSDEEKPVSLLQADAIEEAKRAGTDARAAAENAQTAADNAQAAAENAQTAADNAQAAAENAQTAADNAQKTADSKAAWFTQTVTLYLVDWKDNKQEASVPGVTEDVKQPVILSPENEEDWKYFGIQPVSQGVDKIAFSCEMVPDSDITVNVVGFTVPKKEE